MMRWLIPVLFLAACAPHRRADSAAKVDAVPSVTWEEWDRAHGGPLPPLEPAPRSERAAGEPLLAPEPRFALGDHGLQLREDSGLGSAWRRTW